MRLCAVFLSAFFFSLIFGGSALGQVDSASPLFQDSVCSPEVSISLERGFITVCLNRFEAGADSCADFILRIQKPYCLDVRFRYTFNRRWYFDSVVSQDPASRLPPLSADAAIDAAGALLGMRLSIGHRNDSIKVQNIRSNDDIKQKPPDTALSPVEYVELRSAYRCVDRAVHGVTVHRTFTYPPGYMLREPVYNYPELVMFHCGRGVRLPSSHSLDERGVLINYWHVLNPPPLNYDEEPLRSIDEAKPKPPAPKKEGFIKIRPLRRGIMY